MRRIDLEEKNNKKKKKKARVRTKRKASRKVKSSFNSFFMRIRNVLSKFGNKLTGGKRKTYIKIIIGIVLLQLLIFGGYKAYQAFDFLQEYGGNLQGPTSPGGIANMFTCSLDLEKDGDGYTNALFVGIDTREDGQNLSTDTIIFASYDKDGNVAGLVSIPRDTIVAHTREDLEGYYNRINSMYSTGMNAVSCTDEDTGQLGNQFCEDKEKKIAGVKYLSDVVGNYLGEEVHYSALVNFQAVTQMIDSIGGVDIYVENTFTDYRYPSSDYGTQTVHFDEGITHMDGDLALKYARSRHGQWPEGTDYARSRRQQKLIQAVMQKVKSDKKLHNWDSMKDLIKSLGENIVLVNVAIEDLRSLHCDTLENGFPEMAGIVLDPSIANWTLIGEGNVDFLPNSQFAITPIPNYWEYDRVHEFVDTLQAKPNFVSEKTVVNFYNATGDYTIGYEKYQEFIQEYEYNKISYINSFREQLEGVVIVGDKEEFSASIEEFKTFYEGLDYEVRVNPKDEEGNAVYEPLYGENVMVICGLE